MRRCAATVLLVLLVAPVPAALGQSNPFGGLTWNTYDWSITQ